MVEQIVLRGEVTAAGKSRTWAKETKYDFVTIRGDDGQVTHVEEVRAIGPIVAYLSVGTRGEFYFLEKGPRILYGVRLDDGTVDAIEKWNPLPVWILIVWSLSAIFILIGFFTLPWALYTLYRVMRMNRILDEQFGDARASTNAERIMRPRKI